MIEMSLFRGLLLIVITVVVSSCMFLKLDKDLEHFKEETHVFSGRVSAIDFEAITIVVVALRDQHGDQISGSAPFARPGLFDIRLKPQPQWLFAFSDLNRDFAFQANEPYGWSNDGKAVDPANAPTDQLIIEIIAAADNLLPAPVGVINNPLIDNISDIVEIQIGMVSPLNDPIFSDEQAKKGVEQPYAFVEDGAAGIHFMDDYDPNRIPVLFVHGISDTPRRFKALIDSLDNSRYQAWVYSYPSGWRLSRLARSMYQLLNILHSTYPFSQLHIVAHSMGGLVSRGGLNYCEQDDVCDYLQSYTTISTPWDGVASAATGVEQIELVPDAVPVSAVPAWKYLGLDSDFVTTLFDKPLPAGVPHSLIFGYKQDGIFGSESSDGVIKLSSQLRLVAQEQASQVRGYDEDHISILSSESVITQVNEILKSNSQ